MSVNSMVFELFEQQFTDIVADLQSITTSEARLREALRTEATRAESAEAACAVAKRDTAECRANAAASAAAAKHASAALTVVNEELATAKMKLELSDRQRTLLEEKCIEMTEKIETLEGELQRLRPLQQANSTLQRQYVELESRVRDATKEARSEANRLENELRRVERCAGAGSEVRERARLAAAAHARERRIASAELQHTSRELHTANVEIARLGSLVAELQIRLSEYSNGKLEMNSIIDTDVKALAEAKTALEAERASMAKLERALAAALADNAMLASQLHSVDNSISKTLTEPDTVLTTNVCPIDNFLAE